jgi:uncharacterized sulfatase
MIKKLRIALIFILALGLVASILWQNRINLLVFGAPILTEMLDPIGPNVPTQWSVGPTTAELPADQRPPNIILILADDLGFNDVSLYNGGAADGTLMTPNIDALAEQGVAFTNGYSANAVCAPSRATLLTGRYSTRFGFEFTPFPRLGPRIFQWSQDLDPGPLPSIIDIEGADALPEMTELGMPNSEITIAEMLRDAGYYAAHIGKWHLGSIEGMRPLEQGFNDSLYMAGTLYQPWDHPELVGARRLEDGIDRMVYASGRYRASFNDGEYFQPDGYLTNYYAAESVKVIENNRNRPFFLYLAQWGVHNPLQATAEDYAALAHIEDHHLRVYAGMIRALDRSVGELTKALERNGLAENTLIIFTSDNGGAGYIGLPDVNKPFRGWKLTHFEGGTHVPFMAKWPNRIAPGTVIEAPIHHVDIFRTIAAAANATIPNDRKLDGVDLLPYINGESEGLPHETLFWREGHQQSVLHNGWKLIRANQSDRVTGAPQKKWLFNLSQDPTEQNNLALSETGKVSELEGLLAAHNAEQAAAAWPSVLDAPQMIDKTGLQPYEPGDEYIYWPN